MHNDLVAASTMTTAQRVACTHERKKGHSTNFIARLRSM